MKGRVGTSTGIFASKRMSREFYRKGRRAQRRNQSMGIGAIKTSKPPSGVVVIPPPKT